jgi:hypothetical protein
MRSARSIVRALAALLAVGAAVPAAGQNIDVSTLPPRASTQLTIYNAEDLTLVRETRTVTVREGLNVLQFSWANTLIDPTSVTLRFLAPKSGLELIDTRFPHARPQSLEWTVRADFAGAAEVEIGYFTSGISWSADYVGTVEPGETQMGFDGFVAITNNSGEDYEGASVRLVVGTINLVERIADLARRGIISDAEAGEALARKPGSRFSKLREEARRDLAPAMAADMDGDPRAGGSGGAPKEIEKEGLSEYFIFTVPGTETVANGWTKRLRLFDATKVPIRVVYRYRPVEYGERLARLYLVRNDTASSLGDSPLPDGAVRLYRRTGESGIEPVAFLTTKYVPIGQEFEFDLGSDPQVLFERLVTKNARDDFWFLAKDGRRLINLDGNERIEPDRTVSGWNDRISRAERIRNYRGEPIEVEFRFPIDGDVTFASALQPTLFDFRTPSFTATVPAGTVQDLVYELTVRQGSNAKQSRVELSTAK